ncbi:phosphatase PAP2 family protein [Aquabacterium sp. A08]|uniref:phosphatase PAP2 family protein n=1 Tax=Aquabacterium sp. A08 TaxID=2718532 RepID=UPI00142244F0|nr:phosphatase PAP2 family protein [Aquabacterium sp. A08]NIC40036.1 phosphatase PAP2 family protein [Aquabacterium sp. A08]
MSAPNPPLVLQPLPRRLWWATWALLAAVLVWDASGLDRWVVGGLAGAQGFPLRHHWLLEAVLHDAARHLATLAWVALVAMVVWPLGAMRQLDRWQRVEVATGTALALAAVNLVKRHSLTSCPWDLQAFGGAASYVSHWAWGLADGGPGHCFPGGHASAALAFLALALPWLASSDALGQRRGRGVLGAVLALGLLLGATQTLRGAHYPSHTAWAALVCWAVALANHAVFRRWRA